MKPDELPLVFSRNLLAARRRAGCSQRELARRVGTSNPQIAKWEAGLNSPTLDSVVRLSKALDIPPEALLTEVGGELLAGIPSKLVPHASCS